MNPIVKKDILNVLRQAISIIKGGNLFKLRALSDQVIHNVSVFQDKDSISVAVTIYSLSKIYHNGNNVDKFVLPHLEKAISYLEEGDENRYQSEMKDIIKDISDKDEKTKFYIQEVLERGQIKKGSRMFEHGISMGQVADALGISLWDLMDYVGKTRIVDQFDLKTHVKDKIKMTRQIFNIK